MQVRSTAFSFAMLAGCSGFFGFAACVAQNGPVDARLFSDMQWREIGPMRAGRTRALTGVPSQPATFYLGMVNGGVWKTTDAGATWVESVGRAAVGLHRLHRGRGIESEHRVRRQRRRPAAARSLDRRRRLQIHRRRQDLDASARPARRPADRADRHRSEGSQQGLRRGDRPPLRPERGARPLSARTMAARPSSRCSTPTTAPARPRCRSIRSNPNIVYAGMWQRQEAPWENGSFIGAEGGFYRVHRRRRDLDQADRAWPAGRHSAGADGRSRPATRSASTPRSQPCAAAWSLMRSDDGGENWVHAPVDDTRPEARIGGGDVPVPKVDPKDPDTVYVATRRDLEVDRCGQDLDRPARRARRRRLPERLDQPEQHRHHRARQRSGRHHLAERAARPGPSGTTSRPPRCITSPPTTRFPTASAAASRIAARACVASRSERWPHHVPRLAPRRHRGVRLRRTRSARSRHRLRRQGNALRPPHRADPERRAARAAIARCARSRCSSRRSIRTAFTSRPTRCGSPRTAARTGSRSAPT